MANSRALASINQNTSVPNTMTTSLCCSNNIISLLLSTHLKIADLTTVLSGRSPERFISCSCSITNSVNRSCQHNFLALCTVTKIEQNRKDLLRALAWLIPSYDEFSSFSSYICMPFIDNIKFYFLSST
jgi:hypothetical protein